MKKTNVIILGLFILTGCWPCNSVTIDKGKLSDAALAVVPYENGQVVQFEHSNGLIISFESSRETRQERTSCAECCNEEIYELNSTVLTPDYPIFSFQLEISNIDTIINPCYAYIGSYFFSIPTSIERSEHIEMVDSIILNNKVYYDVFKLESYNRTYLNKDSIYADSLYYNYDFGILQIKMTNDEKYTLQE